MSRDSVASSLFEFHGGLHLRDTLLWFDATAPRQLCFVSHARVSGSLGHHKILATDQTAELMQALAAAHGRGRRAHEPRALVSPYGRTFSIGTLGLELFPSGHVLGAASLLVRHAEVEIVYAGHINPRPDGGLVDRLEARSCDVLVLPCPFGRRRFAFPPLEQSAGALVEFVTDSLARGLRPVLFCSPLGEAQLVASLLHGAGVRWRAHRQIYAACRVYRDAGAELGRVRSFAGSLGEQEALLWPLDLRQSPSLGRLERTATGFVSGLALDRASRQAAACDAAFPISCHADYNGLLEYVRACEPGEVVLMEGDGDELEQDLRALGILVSSITTPRQMSLF